MRRQTIACLLLAWFVMPAHAATVRIGIVDQEFILTRSSIAVRLGGAVYRELKTEVETVRRATQAATAGERRFADEYPGLSGEEAAALEAKVEEQLAEAIRQRQVLDEKVGVALQAQREAMSRKLVRAARTVALEQGLTVVVSREGLLYADELSVGDTVDITRAVIEALKRP